MAKKTISITDIRVLPGRTPDPDSAKQAQRRRRRYRAASIFLGLLMFPVLVWIIIGRIYGRLDFASGAAALLLFSLLMTVYSYFGSKLQVYTGRCGFEQLDENGSPFIGKLVTKKGRIRPVNLLWLLGVFVVSLGIGLLYLWRYPSSDQTKEGFLKIVTGSFSCLGFLFSLLYGFGGMFAVMVYGFSEFWGRLKVFMRRCLPTFLLLQFGFLLVSALLLYLISRLSAGNAEAGTVTEALAQRIVGLSYDAGSPSKMLFGPDSILMSLSSASLYISMYDTIIDRLDEGPGSMREQWKDLIGDRTVRLTALMLLISLVYVGISKLTDLPKVLSWILRIVILGAWLYSTYQSFLDIRPVRWMTSICSVVLVDQLFLLPEVTGLFSGLLMIPAFLLRAAAFVTVGVLIAFYLKLTTETSALSPKEGMDFVHEKTLGEQWKEDNGGKSFGASLMEDLRKKDDGRHRP